jgi:hypothetical protein
MTIMKTLGVENCLCECYDRYENFVSWIIVYVNVTDMKALWAEELFVYVNVTW